MTKISPENFKFNLVAQACRFRYGQSIEWWIWAAKPQTCPKCKQPPYEPCLNLNDLKKDIRRTTTWPHVERVDWHRMWQGLRWRGYMDE